MGTIIPFLRDGLGLRDSVFEPHDIQAMSRALDDVCEVLKLRDSSAKEVIAGRIIDLARRGERSPTRIGDHMAWRPTVARTGAPWVWGILSANSSTILSVSSEADGNRIASSE
jgi:hypothetical protein